MERRVQLILLEEAVGRLNFCIQFSRPLERERLGTSDVRAQTSTLNQLISFGPKELKQLIKKAINVQKGRRSFRGAVKSMWLHRRLGGCWVQHRGVLSREGSKLVY
jgi:hypothetical protein